MHKLELTEIELETLRNLLVETSMRMDDDGNDGAFDASPLGLIYRKIVALRRAAR